MWSIQMTNRQKRAGSKDRPEVVVAIAGIAGHEVTARRFKAGDTGAFRWMLISGRTAGASMALVVICAVLTFQ